MLMLSGAAVLLLWRSKQLRVEAFQPLQRLLQELLRLVHLSGCCLHPFRQPAASTCVPADSGGATSVGGGGLDGKGQAVHAQVGSEQAAGLLLAGGIPTQQLRRAISLRYRGAEEAAALPGAVSCCPGSAVPISAYT